MSAQAQNRHPAGVPDGGQFATTPAAEPDLTLEYTPWCSQPDDHCLAGNCYYGDHGPLTQDAEDALRDGGYGSYLDDMQDTAEQQAEAPVPAREYVEQADFTTANSNRMQTSTLEMAARHARSSKHPQTVDHPNGTGWARTTVQPDGTSTSASTPPPYRQILDTLTGNATPEQLVSAANILRTLRLRWSVRTFAALAADAFDPDQRDVARTVLEQALSQSQTGVVGIVDELLTAAPQDTPGWHEDTGITDPPF